MLPIIRIAKEAHETAIKKGWYKFEDGHPVDRPIDEIFALFHSEVSEAVEELRRGNIDGQRIWFSDEDGFLKYDGSPWAESEGADLVKHKPEGAPVELADLIIRIGDFVSQYQKEKSCCEGYLTCTREESVLLKAPLCQMNDVHLEIVRAQLFEPRIMCYRLGEVISLVEKICSINKWPLRRAIQLKLAYNKTLPHRHGGKKA